MSSSDDEVYNTLARMQSSNFLLIDRIFFMQTIFITKQKEIGVRTHGKEQLNNSTRCFQKHKMVLKIMSFFNRKYCMSLIVAS